MLKRIVSSANVFLIILLTSTTQADDVSITNPWKHSVQYKITIPSTGFDKTITLQPGETRNAIGTDLWHNAVVHIIKIPSNRCIQGCGLLIDEKMMPSSVFTPFYLPEVVKLPHYSECPYTSNLPDLPGCDCFASDPDISQTCQNNCNAVSNAQVIVGTKPLDFLLHHGENTSGQ